MQIQKCMNGPLCEPFAMLIYDKFFWFLITDLARSSLFCIHIPTSGACCVLGRRQKMYRAFKHWGTRVVKKARVFILMTLANAQFAHKESQPGSSRRAWKANMALNIYLAPFHWAHNETA